MSLILTVDDEAGVRLSIRNFLEDLEHDTLEAEDGESGLAMFERHHPDLVLIDLKMPGMGGLELLTRIVQQAPSTPVIVVSGTGVLNDVVNALRCGAWNYLLKPIAEMAVLQHAVDQAFEKAKLIRDNKKYQHHLESSLNKRNEEMANLVNNLPIGLYRTNADEAHVINMSNPEIARMFGYHNKQEFNQIKIADLFVDHKESQIFLQKLFTDGRVSEEEFLMKRKDSSTFWGAITAHVIQDERGISTYVDGVIQDISQRKQAEQEIEHKAYYDNLTDLPNRSLLYDRIHHDIALCKRHNCYGALLFIDLDNFKTINDALGHDIGDELLVTIAQRLQKIVRGSDTLARIGGDEFVILLTDLHKDYESAGFQAQSVAEKALKELSRPFYLKQHTYQQSASIGIALFSGDNKYSVNDLLRWADTAMYSVKKEGRNGIRFFHKNMQQAAEQRLLLEKQLQEHLEEDKFTLLYQPQTDYQGNLLGAECLLRLEKRCLDISPTEFIPIAEETGLIHPIGDWVLKQAMQMLSINDQFINQSQQNNEPIQHQLQHLSINVSTKQFYQENFIDSIIEFVQNHQIQANRLMLEITESVLLTHIDSAITNMNKLKKLGIKFSIDDFGTGFSSLSYLKKLPIDELKIDKSFIDDIHTDKDAMTIVETIIGMAKNLNISIIAEGVENRQQLELLHQAGCKIFQGFYFSKPLSSDSFKQLISQNNNKVVSFRHKA